MFSHVMIGSNDIEESKKFYDKLLKKKIIEGLGGIWKSQVIQGKAKRKVDVFILEKSIPESKRRLLQKWHNWGKYRIVLKKIAGMMTEKSTKNAMNYLRRNCLLSKKMKNTSLGLIGKVYIRLCFTALIQYTEKIQGCRLLLGYWDICKVIAATEKWKEHCGPGQWRKRLDPRYIAAAAVYYATFPFQGNELAKFRKVRIAITKKIFC